MEARSLYDVSFRKTDEELLIESCSLYLESIDTSETNSEPTDLTGEAVVTGCQGFQSPRMVIRDGRASLSWLIKTDRDSPPSLDELRHVWSRIDFEGPAKKVVELRFRPIRKIPPNIAEDRSSVRVVLPHRCILQASHAALGGQFVDIVSFELDPKTSEDGGWKRLNGFRSSRSKGWRLLVERYQCDAPVTSLSDVFVGIEVEMFEPEISADSLQRLHILFNLSLSTSLLGQIQPRTSRDEIRVGKTAVSLTDIDKTVSAMEQECDVLEGQYMEGARILHRASKTEFRKANKLRTDAETNLLRLGAKRIAELSAIDLWNEGWWNDILSCCLLYGSEGDRAAICDRVKASIADTMASASYMELRARVTAKLQKVHTGGATERSRVSSVEHTDALRALDPLPVFHNVDGLELALKVRLAETDDWKEHLRSMKKVSELSEKPTEAETMENSRCGVCKADWNQTGPTCRHCKLEETLLSLEANPVVVATLQALWKWMKDYRPSSGTGRELQRLRKEGRLDERAKSFFAVFDAAKAELKAAKAAWMVHSNLLNDIDEVNQSKRAMRLVGEGEDLTRLTDDELNAVVVPYDIPAKFMDHNAKQAMHLAHLRRQSSTLRYLRNQSKERREESRKADLKKRAASEGNNNRGKDTPNEDDDGLSLPNCLLCLCPMEGERAVLMCGHSFHGACIDKLVTKSRGSIICPLRCNQRTKKDDVMMATDKRRDDGTRGPRDVKGSFGTKVTKLVGDLMDVRDKDEKAVVFSQWEGMLEVVEQALIMNKIEYVRVKSMSKIGESINRFRLGSVSVLLLNVKNGAEGLTLVEATHVFMVEPLLNAGLDSQAINRVHRIGQTSKTYVHRYLIRDTIEEKIDRIRMDRQDVQQMEESINETRQRRGVPAGGIDGGLSVDELQSVLASAT